MLCAKCLFSIACMRITHTFTHSSWLLVVAMAPITKANSLLKLDTRRVCTKCSVERVYLFKGSSREDFQFLYAAYNSKNSLKQIIRPDVLSSYEAF